MKYLSDSIDWSSIKAIGFDLDGTLYDEFDFIKQAYQSVLSVFSADEDVKDKMVDFMLNRWLEKGSSYPYIFDECLQLFQIPEFERQAKIEQALDLFRTFQPDLELCPRMKNFLSDCCKKYFLFLVTDGRKTLQMQKIQALELDRYFQSDTIFISGALGKGYEKPNTLVLGKIKLDNKGIANNEVVYIGDRIRDKDFAANAGFRFCFIQDLFKRIE